MGVGAPRCVSLWRQSREVTPKRTSLEERLPSGLVHRHVLTSRKNNRVRSNTPFADAGAKRKISRIDPTGATWAVQAVAPMAVAEICEPGRGALWGW